MSKDILMQFVGFSSRATAREYTFTVREASTEPREFTVTIAHEAFNAHRVRFQDAPDVCALRLRRELAISGNHPSETHFQITDAELDDYRTTHAGTPRKSMFGRRPAEG
jgi:hypothetical protein